MMKHVTYPTIDSKRITQRAWRRWCYWTFGPGIYPKTLVAGDTPRVIGFIERLNYSTSILDTSMAVRQVKRG